MQKRTVSTGEKYGRLTVVKQLESKGGHSFWECTCDCGKTKVARGVHLGKTINSCGCLRNDRIKHGHHKGGKPTQIYRIWEGMMSRCYCPGDSAYRYYGKRGLTVSDEWHNFENFYRDMGDKPYKLSIDRVDNYRGYSKENCRWATAKEQANNKRPRVTQYLHNAVNASV